MKKPQWATVIGIIGIMLGCFGLTEAVQTLAKPRLLLLQNGIVQHMHMNGEERGSGSEEKVHRESNIQHVPPWFKTWCTASGLTALIISGFYLFTAIRLFQLKPGALQLFIPAVVLSLCFAFIKVTVMLSITIFAGSPLLTGLIIGAVINLLLLTLAANTEQQ
ncbi:MAG: hypothetical protein GY868_11105, partial [Deltaproteobacteria bacterium]|nr:hypothetical protein [Deltaproteobacteria bacterium]